MSIYLIRHGETDGNAERVVQVPAVPLNQRGLAQARRVANRLASWQPPVAKILTSDLSRALMTAQAIQDATGADLVEEPLLQERNFGDLRGRAYAEIGFDIMADGYEPPAGESWERFHQRVDRAWQLVQSESEGLRRASTEPTGLAVVAHGLVCRSLVDKHLGLDRFNEVPDHWGNTSLTVIESEPPWQVTLLNCTAHLEGAVADNRQAISGI